MYPEDRTALPPTSFFLVTSSDAPTPLSLTGRRLTSALDFAVIPYMLLGMCPKVFIGYTVRSGTSQSEDMCVFNFYSYCLGPFQKVVSSHTQQQCPCEGARIQPPRTPWQGRSVSGEANQPQMR
ncbi:hypothetical protein HJG60_009863 [Phyllostomus discolor]|uniref:Uncharacterized protein n=1 Tax=Phyllostomus discolor TaxID=89673 RepID=A0A834BA68_9CHIR|nr:hypothetical protein HJG60_009863 [Phyllostomus discolor]